MDLLFDETELCPWKREWQNMPEFSHEDLSPRFQIIVNFACEADLKDFSELIGQKINPSDTGKQLQSIWVPEQEIGRITNKRYIRREP
jgi:hypothetical protein